MTEKCHKLLRLALCPSAHTGEWENAARAFIFEARKNKETPETLLATKRAGFMFQFGAHKGEALEDIDTGYLEWAHQNLTKLAPNFRTAILAEINLRHQNK